ncbi:MFS transporter [Gordonia defluvii]|jgi:EmrB/QacA subfamily drug resistance transporter|uniref:MFS transporter n=1 Tax=Gordonia defluvii TaxID=283718 RepID=A0ABP6LC86_9ACTN|nr:MFS transporter [Gordonia sp. UBA5067]
MLSVPNRFTRSQRITLAVVCAATAMLMLDIAVVNTALPAMAREFTADLNSLKWVVDGYTLALATVVLTAGAWADRAGRRRVFVLGAVVFTVASAACAMAPGMFALNIARVVQGLGGALLFATSLALLAHAFPGSAARTKSLAVYGATIGASFAVGPLLGGVLTDLLDWRTIFLANIPVGAAMLIGVRWVDESRSALPRGGDWAGQATVMVGLASLTYGLFEASSRGWTDPVTVAALGVAGVALVAFLVVEDRVAEPMMPLTMFANRGFAGAQIATFAISASMFAVFVYVTIYLQGVLGLSPIAAGLVYLPGTMMMFVAAGVTDRILGRVAPWILIAVGLAAVAGGMAWMTVGGVDSGPWDLVGGFMLAAVGAGVFNPVLSGVVLAESESDDAGLAAGINDAFRQAGIAIGVAGLGAFFPAQSVLHGGSPHGFVDGLHTALWCSAAIAGVGVVVVAATMRRARATEPASAADASDPVVAGRVYGSRNASHEIFAPAYTLTVDPSNAPAPRPARRSVR